MQASNRKQQGFTLVEVIVVAVIVAALAAVSVPLYLNYVNSSRTNAASNTAGSVASFMGACRNQGGYVSASAGSITAGTATSAALTLQCISTVSPAGTVTISIPADLSVTISDLGAAGTPIAAGTVKAKHAGGGSDSPTFSY